MNKIGKTKLSEQKKFRLSEIVFSELKSIFMKKSVKENYASKN